MTDAPADLAERLRPALVPAQLAAMGVVVAPGGAVVRLPAALRAAGLTLAAAGAGLAWAGAAAMGHDLTPQVDPRPGASLQTRGAFRLSRHPIYAGLLLSAAGWTAFRGHVRGVLGTAALAGVLHLKAVLEERRLEAAFGAEYATYAARTPRFLGFMRPAVPAARADRRRDASR
jgi:protein-S-isoprenylcysteine O-methyltransferase Ste14